MHLPYSSDLSLSHFHFFPHLKKLCVEKSFVVTIKRRVLWANDNKLCSDISMLKEYKSLFFNGKNLFYRIEIVVKNEAILSWMKCETLLQYQHLLLNSTRIHKMYLYNRFICPISCWWVRYFSYGTRQFKNRDLIQFLNSLPFNCKLFSPVCLSVCLSFFLSSSLSLFLSLSLSIYIYIYIYIYSGVQVDLAYYLTSIFVAKKKIGLDLYLLYMSQNLARSTGNPNLIQWAKISIRVLNLFL